MANLKHTIICQQRSKANKIVVISSRGASASPQSMNLRLLNPHCKSSEILYTPCPNPGQSWGTLDSEAQRRPPVGRQVYGSDVLLGGVIKS